MKSWYEIRARATGADVLIYDEIGAYGVSAKGFLAELGALPDEVPIDLRLNSPGGSVFDAVAIYNALQRHAGPVTAWIDGIAASAASYIAMAGDEIVMAENAFLMIHDPSGLVVGTAEDMRSMAEALDKVKGSLVAGYAAKSSRTPEDIGALMAAETWFDATDALAAGLATRLVQPVRIAANFDIGRFRNAPPALADAVVAVMAPDDAADAALVRRDEDVAEDTDDGEGHQLSDAEDAQAADTDALGPPAEMPPIGAPPDPNAIRAEVLAHARAVVDLCRLAGRPEMAGGFIAQDTNFEEVRAALLAANAEAEPQISPHHPQPGPTPSARPWGDVIARTFRQKG
jgi:ATP-dependent Clp protease protease subunit